MTVRDLTVRLIEKKHIYVILRVANLMSTKLFFFSVFPYPYPFILIGLLTFILTAYGNNV